MVNVLFVLILLAGMLAALSVIPSLMTRRAVSKVIKVFCQSDALDAAHARTPDELGLAPRAFLERLTKPRDYKPQALRILKDAHVLHTAPDGRLYLSQPELVQGARYRTPLARQVQTAFKKYARKDGGDQSVAE